jgi:hypothetical protein
MQRNAMKTAMDPELEALKATPKPRSMGEHPYKGFFFTRRITQKKIAKAVGIQEAYLSMMFSGLMYMDPETEKKLNDLKEKILAWEKKTGEIFGAGSK